MEAKNPLLRIENLSISFQEGRELRPVLKSLSLSIQPGECSALVGESGSGKSVTALSILRLLSSPPAIYTQGSIYWSPEGQSAQDVLQWSPKELLAFRGKQVAMIFQEPMSSLNPLMKCGEQVKEALRIHRKLEGEALNQEALRWFEEVKLPRAKTLLQAYPHQLSGGQKQRVMIAMAMCGQPRLLIADEPTTALDVTVQHSILSLMQQLQQTYGMALLLISHDLGVVREVAQHMTVLYQGEKMEEGETEQVLKHPQSPYTQALLASRPRAGWTPTRIPTVSEVMKGMYTPDSGIYRQRSSVERKEQAEAVHTGTPVLVANEVTVKYSSRSGNSTLLTAVDRVSLEIYPDEVVGLVGESGSGKSTLCRALIGLQPIAEGSVVWEGKKLSEMSESQIRPLRSQFQLIFQDPYSALNPRLTVRQMLMEPIQVHFPSLSSKERKERVEDLLLQTGMDPVQHGDRYPHEFSGGQRQRIVIARALSVRPKFLICDESVSALDVSVQAQILNLLNDLKAQYRFAILFISHDLEVVRYMSDRILVMHQGKLVESGWSDEIYANPQHPYTQELLHALPVWA